MIAILGKYIFRKPKNLNDYERNIFSIFFIFFCLAAIISLILLFFFYQNLTKRENALSMTALKSENIYLQTTISDNLKLILNNPEFFAYLNEGVYSQRIDTLTPKKFFHNFNKSKLLIGIEIKKNHNILYAQGKQTQLHVTLGICYLNNIINNNFGECKYKATLYFSPEEYISKISSDNYETKTCSLAKNRCLYFKPFINYFGDFPVESSHGNLSLKKKNKIQYILFPSFLISIIFIFFLYVSQRAFRYLTNRYLSTPIKEMSLMLQENNYKNIDLTNVHHLEEVNLLTKQIIEYENNRSLIYYGKILLQTAHDMSSPLMILDLCLKNIKNSTEKESMLMKSAIEELRETSKKLLADYKKSNAKPQNIKTELCSLLTTFANGKNIEFANKNMKLFINTKLKEKYVFGDAAEIKRILSNIINNAIDAKRGEIIKIKISLYIKNEYVYLKISDNGAGIPKDNIDKVLSFGFTSKNNGNGIGLSYAKNTMETLGGKITIQSKENFGTIITLMFPDNCSKGS